ncbi:MAG: cytochrome c [Phycisphaeraceae bacterium]|nr:cytochrome c [Phycisphaeraceae bacterium]
MPPKHSAIRAVVIGAATAGALLAGLSGCRDDRTAQRPRQFFPDMDDQPKFKTQGENPLFADGRSMREPVAGTVAFGRQAELEWAEPSMQAYANERISRQRADLLRAEPEIYLGIAADGKYIDTIPIPVTPELLQRGMDRYNIYCIVCHGATGAGKGAVGIQWSYPLPNFHDAQYQRGGEKGQDGYLFHVIRNGVANAPGQQPALKMPAYSQQLSERDAWAVVAYFRALQTARRGSIDRVPTAQRQELDRTRGAQPTGQENAQ